MQVTINGQEMTIECESTVKSLLSPYRADNKAVVLELNGEVVTNDDHPISEGDTIEIVTFVGGG
mgnify:CR=1 FL=1